VAIDRETRKRIATAADERAARAGMRFDAERAAFACDWIGSNCCLYEGERAGELIELLPFQRDFFERLFGWVRWSDEWEGWIRRFTRASLWAAKKNGKSPLAAAYNLYMLCADGEQGQKVYMMAKNGSQAKIAQDHAINMVRQSPLLSCDRGGDCKINNTTLAITHSPTRSVLSVVTGDDKRGADAKHGYNGSVTIDEMHVVSRTMIEAVGRAGLSRREPLQVSFSTAGSDPTSVGHERFAYGRQVNSGERLDPHFLHVEYCAPDDATDVEIDERLEEFGKMANPAWGAMIKPSQFRADWDSVKGNAREVAVFKMERLNLWVGSTNRWLSSAGWQKGARKFALADLAGRECFAALDLSRTRDLTAFVLLFPWPEGGPECVRLWPMFWMPEDTARERDHLFPFKSWAAGGFIKLTPGGIVDYSVVKEDARAAITGNRLKVLKLRYDEKYANEITQALFEGERVGSETAPGVVGGREVFDQNIMVFTAPSKEFERRVSAGLIQHPDNKVLTWQIGHCEVKTDVNQNIRPVKPAPHSGKSVDGVVCCVMATSNVMVPADALSVYETRGIVQIGGEPRAGELAPEKVVGTKSPVAWINPDDDDDDDYF
jgi:phage terminase large subunit-like protein